MKIIQSHWSKPSTINSPSRAFGGWLTPRFHKISLALSCLQLKRFYQKIELYTDDTGLKLLHQELELPYSNIHVFDKIDNYNPGLFSLSKILSILQQNEPFIHVDGDVFIWEEFPEWLVNSSLIVQSKQIGPNPYKIFFENAVSILPYFPTYLKQFNTNTIEFVNNGILGGKNVNFLHRYANEVLNFISLNDSQLCNIDLNLFNAMSEEVLLTEFSLSQNVEISEYIPTMNQDFFSITDFDGIGKATNYIHLIGTHKQYLANCMRMEQRLQVEHKDYYNKHFA
jgi:hypothetical protein